MKKTRTRVNHFEYPITCQIRAKHALLKLFETFYYAQLEGKHIPFIQGSFVNSEALLRQPKQGNIFIFQHQPFIHYLVVLLCVNGFPINSLVRGHSRPPKFIRDLGERINYHRYVYAPLITIKKLRERLLEGENVLIAADGKKHHHLMVRFGRAKLATPKGPYMLSRITGAPIVPLCLKLRGMLPFPRFEVRVGERYFMEDTPEAEIEKIEAIFSWYYSQLSKQPYMWNKIGWQRNGQAADPGD
jgi:lauroyl/myristoyl acyltransferase